MTGSLIRSAICLVTLVVSYQVYVMVVVPIVEPAGVTRSSETISAADRETSNSAIERYQQFLAAYFPSDHWSLGSPPPKLVRQQQMMMVLSDYKRSDGGLVEFEKCALLLLPKTWTPGSPPPRETVIIEAPGGASFQFDEDFRPTQGQMGRIVEGSLPGPITVRSDMENPGPDDDLFISTRDLVLNETVIHTGAPVEARLGKSRLTGTEMEIRLSRDEHIARGPSINGVQSLQIYRDVRMRLDAGNIDLLQKGEKGEQPEQPPAYDPPVVITCKGRLYLDLLEFVASFEQQVEVRRERLEGPYDQLDCNHLSVRFAAVDERGMVIDLTDDPNVARKQSAAAGKLQPVAIEATGSPVRAEAPVEKASARAQRLRIDLLKRRITLDGGGDVMMSYEGNEVHAPFIEYTIPDKDSPSVIGDLSLSGPGWLRVVPDIERPDRVVDLLWKLAPGNPYPVQIRRERGQPVLYLTGNPAIDAHRLGRITAARMELALREVPGDGPDGPAIELTDSTAKLAVIPERLLAAGQVVFESPQLIGRTQQLHATFDEWSSAAPGETGDSPMKLVSDRGDEPKSQYDLTASQIHLDLALTGKAAEPTGAVCDGGVVLKQVRTARPGELPMEVRGERLTLDDLDTGAKITVFGRAGGTSPQEGLASVVAQGLTISARQVHADQEKGSFWIDGAGQATMQVDGEMFGQPDGKPVPVTLSWQSKMHGEGQRIVAEGRVQVVGQQSLMQGDRAVAILSRPIGVGKEAGGKVEVAEVGLEGNVVIDYRAQDPAGQQSHENLQLSSIKVNRLTGAIEGAGPGVLRSRRYSDSVGSFAALGSANPVRPQSGADGTEVPELRFLRVDFVQGITGNIDQRVLRFHRRVQSVYGPVTTWQEELSLHDPTRLPPEAVTLRCETLVVGEDPVAARLQPRRGEKGPMGPLEVQAVGNVAIEGRNKDMELFQAEGAKATYNQAKDVVILEGDGQRYAVIRQRDPANGRSVDTPVRKLLYYRSQSNVQIEGLLQLDYQQNAVRPQVNTPR